MIQSAEAINTFPIPKEEEQIFVLTSSQLTALMSQAVEKAIQPIEDKLSELEEAMDLRAREIAQDRQRIAKLEQIDPSPSQRDRGEVLRALLAANGGKMLAKDARKIMRLSEPRFSELLGTVPEIGKRPYHQNKRQNIVYLKSAL